MKKSKKYQIKKVALSQSDILSQIKEKIKEIKPKIRLNFLHVLAESEN
jgi:hypothetical protein